MRKLLSIVFALIVCATATLAQKPSDSEPKPLPTIHDKIEHARSMPGYFPLYWDERAGRLWLEIDKFDTEFLFADSLPAGVGSNDIELDRGQPGESRVVRFQRVGPKVLLVEMNYKFRATSSNAFERRAVADAFAQSVLWGFEVAAEENGRVLIDATPFFLTDVHGIADKLKSKKQGAYKIDTNRSAVYLPATKNFPQNTEIESTLTFAGDEPGEFVRDVVPDPKAITVREHFSFVQLPDSNFHARALDPRAGYFGIEFMDYSSAPGSSITKRFIARHRLAKKDPKAAVSEPVKPIVYYLDPGTPEPIRSALLDGARWWNQAFEAAGYRNAFRVEMLPDDVDPMDIRYNVIEWIHRSTRGWAYGSAIVDPRTGEIINGHVSLDSLRWRQDYLILEGLLSPHKKGAETDPRVLETALARIRQLAAHELGHTLGLSHNYIASAQGRTSVMDYPHPLITLAADGGFDLSNAYAKGIGEWDKVAIEYGYYDFAPGTDEHVALNSIIDRARSRGMTYLTDQDARPAGSSHPQVNLWDNGANAVDELNRVLAVRARALEKFSDAAIPEGEPMAQLADTLVPVYLFHRYQTEAATKTIGGEFYTYALRGDGQRPTAPVAAAEQRRALAAVLKTIAPETLAIPERIVAMLPPHPAEFDATRESFKGHTGLTFDPLGAAEGAAHQTISVLLNADRTSRLVQFHAADAQQLGLAEVLDQLIAATWKSKSATPRLAEVQHVTADVALDEMLALAFSDKALPQAKAIAWLKLRELRQWAEAQSRTAQSEDERAHLAMGAALVRRYEEHPELPLKRITPIEPPPGMPIGMGELDDFQMR